MTQSQNNSNLDDELLSAYIDGELTDAERAAVETRLETDPAARELVAEMRSLSGTLKSLPREVLAEDLRGAVLSQIGASQVSLPPARLSMAHRMIWPALAIAAALMLMFVQGNRDRGRNDLAKVDEPAAGTRERVLADDAGAAFEAPEEEAPTLEAFGAPAAPVPLTGDRMMAADADVPPTETAAGAFLSEGVEEPAVAARRVTDAMAAREAELEGVVHLTLTDFRSGAERFNRLLVSNGVQLVDEQAATPAASTPVTDAPTADSFDSVGRVAGEMSTRSAAPMRGVGGAATTAVPVDGASSVSELELEEPEMVLVEAPPEQIEQILFGCAQDTEAIEEVAVDPTASGMNTAPAKQRLSDYQQYSRSSGKLALGNKYQVTPEQQNAIAVFNSVPKQAELPTENAEDEQRGWAARFYANEKPVQADKLNWQYNQYRDQYFYSQARQQQAIAKGEGVDVPKKLAKGKVAADQPLRVLFLLHPSAEAAKK